MKRVRRAVPSTVKSYAKIARARMFEKVGSGRYSWPALNDLDRQLIPYLDGATKTFLEIGANDGYSQSNTYHLERFLGWDGMLIEPLPALFRICARHRRAHVLNYACVAEGGPEWIEIADRGLMSVSVGVLNEDEERRRIGDETRRIRAATSTLSRLIDESAFPRIGFMSIDVEGAEQEVLSGLDLARHTPDIMLVETTNPEAIDSLLGDNMRRIGQLSHHDHLYMP